MSLRRLLISVIFYTHLVIFLIFPLGFLIPSSLWGQRIEFHFWFSFGLTVLFFLWGSIWTLKFKDKVYRICILDTFMQWLRGFSMFDPRNYEHSFTEEVIERFKIKVTRAQMRWGLLICLLLSLLLYVFKLNGIVLF